MPNIDDDIRKAGKRLKALRKTASAHNKANRIFVYKRDGHNVSEDSLKSQMRSKGLSTESRAAAHRREQGRHEAPERSAHATAGGAQR